MILCLKALFGVSDKGELGKQMQDYFRSCRMLTRTAQSLLE